MGKTVLLQACEKLSDPLLEVPSEFLISMGAKFLLYLRASHFDRGLIHQYVTICIPLFVPFYLPTGH